MSRTLPRATGGMPAKFVSRMTFIAGAAPIDPPESVLHSIPRRGDVNVTTVAVQEEQRYCGGDVKLKFLRRKRRADCSALDVGRLILFYAAVAARCLVGFSLSPSQRTLTSLETPGSCIVTPYRTLPVSIVLRL